MMESEDTQQGSETPEAPAPAGDRFEDTRDAEQTGGLSEEADAAAEGEAPASETGNEGCRQAHDEASESGDGEEPADTPSDETSGENPAGDSAAADAGEDGGAEPAQEG